MPSPLQSIRMPLMRERWVTMSLPLDRAGRLRRIIVNHAVDAVDLIDDPRGDAAEEGGVEWIDVGGHSIDAGHGTQTTDVIIGAIVTHHADGPHRQQHRERLPDRVVEARVANLVEIDGVGLPEDVAFFASDLAGDADGEPRPRERMPGDEGLGQAELAAEFAHLVLEQFAQRLDEL